MIALFRLLLSNYIILRFNITLTSFSTNSTCSRSTNKSRGECALRGNPNQRVIWSGIEASQ